MRGPRKLLFGGLVVLYGTTKPPINSLLGPRMLENELRTFAKKVRSEKVIVSFWTMLFLAEVRSPLSNMRGPSKLLIGGLVVP